MLARDLARKFDSPANQLVLVNPLGQIYGCVNGWVGVPLVSKSVSPETTFRFASLSKIVSFAGLVREEAHGGTKWLDMPVTQVIGIFPPFADTRLKDLRIRQLLNHTGGFDRHRTTDSMVVRNSKPWCPYSMEKLPTTRLDFAPGSRYAYANIGYCLAAVAFEKRFGKSLWTSLEQDVKLSNYGIGYLEDVDSPVSYNFMHNGFYSEDFVEYFDWHALRGPMGMVGNAHGLARFIQDNREVIAYSIGMHRNDPATCDDKKAEGCYDGFLERRRLSNGDLIWNQKGYLYGMSSIFLTDASGNMLIWLGSGDVPERGKVYDFVQDSFDREVRQHRAPSTNSLRQ